MEPSQMLPSKALLSYKIKTLIAKKKKGKLSPWRCLLIFGVISKAKNRDTQIFLRVHKRQKIPSWTHAYITHVPWAYVTPGHN